MENTNEKTKLIRDELEDVILKLKGFDEEFLNLASKKPALFFESTSILIQRLNMVICEFDTWQD